MFFAFAIIIFCIFSDQISKYLARKYLKNKKSRRINKNIKLTYVENSGGANGVFSGNYLVLYIVTFISLFICLLLFEHYDIQNNTLYSVSLCVFVGGILGNFIDRLLFSYVTDFISIRMFNKYFPVFNFADVYILLGMLITFVTYLFI